MLSLKKRHSEFLDIQYNLSDLYIHDDEIYILGHSQYGILLKTYIDTGSHID